MNMSNRLAPANSVLTNNTSVLNTNGSVSAVGKSGSGAMGAGFGASNDEESGPKKPYNHRNVNGGKSGHHHNHHHHHNNNHHQHHNHHHHQHHHSFQRHGMPPNNENANPNPGQQEESKRFHSNKRASSQKQKSINADQNAGVNGASDFAKTSESSESSTEKASVSDAQRADEEKAKAAARSSREDDFYDDDDTAISEKLLSNVERLLYCTNPYTNEPSTTAYDSYNSFSHSHSLPQLPIYSYPHSFKSDLKSAEDELINELGAISLRTSESEPSEIDFSLARSTSSSSSDLTKPKAKESSRKNIGMFNDFKLNPFHHQNMDTFGRFIRQSLNLKSELVNDIVSNPRIQYWIDRNRSHGFVYQTYPRIDETKKRVPSVRCELCKFYGHLSHTCSIREFAFKLNNVVLRNGATRCHICGQLGHPAEAGLCPYITCSFCSQNGHWNYMCPHKDKISRTLCHKCQRYGHNTERCPDQWRQFDRISTFEQTAYRDPNETNKPVYCYQCAQKGHYGYNCPEFYRKYFIRDYHHLDTYPIYFFAASSPFVKHSVKFNENDKRIVSYLVDLPIDGTFRQDTVDKDALEELESFQSKIKEQNETNLSIFEETHLNIPLKEYIRKWSNWVIDFHWTFTLKYFIESLPTKKLHFFIKNYPSLDNFILNWMWWTYSLNKELERFTKDPFRAIGSKAWLCNDITSETIEEQLRSDSKKVKSHSMSTSSSMSSSASSLSPGQSSASNSRMKSDLPVFHSQDNKMQKYASMSMDHMMTHAYIQQPIYIAYSNPIQNAGQPYKKYHPATLVQMPPQLQHQLMTAMPSNQNPLIHQQAFYYHPTHLPAPNMMMGMTVSNLTSMKPPSPTTMQSMRLVQTNPNFQVNYTGFKTYNQSVQQQQQYSAKPSNQAMSSGKGPNGYKRERRNSAKSQGEKFTIDSDGNFVKEEFVYKPNGARRFGSAQQHNNHLSSSEQIDNRRRSKSFEKNKNPKLSSYFSTQGHVLSPQESIFESLEETTEQDGICSVQDLMPIEATQTDLDQKCFDDSTSAVVDLPVAVDPSTSCAEAEPEKAIVDDVLSTTEELEDAAYLKPVVISRYRSKSLSEGSVPLPSTMNRSSSQLLNKSAKNSSSQISSNNSSTVNSSLSTIKTAENETGKDDDLDKTIVYFDLGCCEEEKNEEMVPEQCKTESPDDDLEPIEIVVISDEPRPETCPIKLETLAPLENLQESASPECLLKLDDSVSLKAEVPKSEEKPLVVEPIEEIRSPVSILSSTKTDNDLKRMLEEKLHIKLASSSEKSGESVSSDNEKPRRFDHDLSPKLPSKIESSPELFGAFYSSKPIDIQLPPTSNSFSCATSSSTSIGASPSSSATSSMPKVECNYSEIICSNAAIVPTTNEQSVFEKFFKSFNQPAKQAETQPEPNNNILDLLKRSSSNHSSFKQIESTDEASCNPVKLEIHDDVFAKTNSFGDKQNQKESENLIKLLLKIDNNTTYRPNGFPNETGSDQKSLAAFASLSPTLRVQGADDIEELNLEKVDESILRCRKNSDTIGLSGGSCLKLALPVPSLNVPSELPGIIVDTKLSSKPNVANLMSLCSSSSSASSSSAVSSAISISPSSPLFSPKSASSYTPSLSSSHLSTSMTSNESITIKQILQPDTLTVPNGGTSSLSTSASSMSLSSASVSTSSLSSVLSHNHSRHSSGVSHQRNIIDLLVNDGSSNESNNCSRADNSLRSHDQMDHEAAKTAASHVQQIDAMLQKIKESNDCIVNLDNLFRKGTSFTISPTLSISPQLPESSLALSLLSFEESSKDHSKPGYQNANPRKHKSNESRNNSSKQRRNGTGKNVIQFSDQSAFDGGSGSSSGIENSAYMSKNNQSLDDAQKMHHSGYQEMVKSASSMAQMIHVESSDRRGNEETSNNSYGNQMNHKQQQQRLRESNSKRALSNGSRSGRNQKRNSSSGRKSSGYDQKGKRSEEADHQEGMISNYYELKSEHRHHHHHHHQHRHQLHHSQSQPQQQQAYYYNQRNPGQQQQSQSQHRRQHRRSRSISSKKNASNNKYPFGQDNQVKNDSHYQFGARNSSSKNMNESNRNSFTQQDEPTEKKYKESTSYTSKSKCEAGDNYGRPESNQVYRNSKSSVWSNSRSNKSNNSSNNSSFNRTNTPNRSVELIKRSTSSTLSHKSHPDLYDSANAHPSQNPSENSKSSKKLDSARQQQQDQPPSLKESNHHEIHHHQRHRAEPASATLFKTNSPALKDSDSSNSLNSPLFRMENTKSNSSSSNKSHKKHRKFFH